MSYMSNALTTAADRQETETMTTNKPNNARAWIEAIELPNNSAFEARVPGNVGVYLFAATPFSALVTRQPAIAITTAAQTTKLGRRSSPAQARRSWRFTIRSLNTNPTGHPGDKITSHKPSIF